MVPVLEGQVLQCENDSERQQTRELRCTWYVYKPPHPRNDFCNSFVYRSMTDSAVYSGITEHNAPGLRLRF